MSSKTHADSRWAWETRPRAPHRRQPAGGHARLGERRPAARRGVARHDRLHRRVQGPGHRAAPGAPAQRRRRRPGRPRRARRRAARRLRLPARLLSLLGARARARRPRARAVRRELHGRGPGRRRGLHRRPLPDRHARSSRSPSRGSRATASASAWTTRASPRCSSRTAAPASTSASSRRARCRPGDEIVKLASGPEADDGRRGRRAALPPRAPAPAAAPRAAHPRAQPGWQASFRALLDGGAGRAATRASAAAGPPPAWPGFRPPDGHGHRARERRRDLDPLRRARRRAAAGRRTRASTSPCASGPTARQRSVLRNYSLSGPPDAGHYRDRRQARARRRRRAATSTAGSRSGDQLEVAAPRGTFILDRATRPCC